MRSKTSTPKTTSTRDIIIEWLTRQPSFQEITNKAISIGNEGGFESAISLMTNIKTQDKRKNNSGYKKVLGLFHFSSKEINKQIKAANKKYKEKREKLDQKDQKKRNMYFLNILNPIQKVIQKTLLSHSDIIALQEQSSKNNKLTSRKGITIRHLKETLKTINELLLRVKNIFAKILLTNFKIDIINHNKKERAALKQENNIANMIKIDNKLLPIYSFQTKNKYVLASSPSITLDKENWVKGMLSAMKDSERMFLFDMVFADGKKILNWRNNTQNSDGTISSYQEGNNNIVFREKLEKNTHSEKLLHKKFNHEVHYSKKFGDGTNSIYFKEYEIEITDKTTKKKTIKTITIPIVTNFVDHTYISEAKSNALYEAIESVFKETTENSEKTISTRIGAICRQANNRSQAILTIFELRSILTEILEKLEENKPINLEDFKKEVISLKEPLIMLATSRISVETKPTLYSQVDIICNLLPKIAEHAYNTKHQNQKKYTDSQRQRTLIKKDNKKSFTR